MTTTNTRSTTGTEPAYPPDRIERLASPSQEVLDLLEEYYTAFQVQRRDTPEALGQYLAQPRSALWLAFFDSKPAGCVLLRDLPGTAVAAECKRLYVRPEFRGKGLASALMDALEAHARTLGLQAVFLDTTDIFADAITLYRRRGYVECDRFNDNPQATLFFRKLL